MSETAQAYSRISAGQAPLRHGMALSNWLQLAMLLGALATAWMALDRRLTSIETKVQIMYEHTQFSH